jgi:hypothetical protein
MTVTLKFAHISIALAGAILGMAIEASLSTEFGGRTEAKFLPRQIDETEAPFSHPPRSHFFPPEWFFDGGSEGSGREYERPAEPGYDPAWQI